MGDFARQGRRLLELLSKSHDCELDLCATSLEFSHWKQYCFFAASEERYARYEDSITGSCCDSRRVD